LHFDQGYSLGVMLLAGSAVTPGQRFRQLRPAGGTAAWSSSINYTTLVSLSTAER